MKLMKKSLSVFLALLMMFSSVSLLAASALDTYNWTSEVKFFRQERDAEGNVKEDSWVEANGKVMPGESVRARFYLDAEFAVAGGNYLFVYPTNFLTADYSQYTPDGKNYIALINPDSKAAANNVTGLYFIPGVSNIVNSQISLGIVSEEDFEGLSWIYACIDAGSYSVTLNPDDWYFELAFTVNETLPENEDGTLNAEGLCYLLPACVADYDNYEAATYIQVCVNGDGSPNTDSFATWEDQDFDTLVTSTLNDSTGTESTLTSIKSTVTFDANGGKWSDGETTKESTDYIDYTKTVAAPADPTYAGGSFVGWALPKEDDTQPTADDVVDISTVKYAHDDVTYLAVYALEKGATIIANYKDALTGEMKTVMLPVASTEGYTVKIVDDKDIPAEEDKEPNTTYVAYSALPGVTHYAFDSANANNQFSAIVAADGSTTLNLYYSPVNYTASFGSDDVEDITDAYGTEITLPEGPKVTGKNFTGWKVADGTIYEAGASYQLLGNASFEAQYENAETTVAVKIKYTDVTDNTEKTVDVASKADAIIGTTYTIADFTDATLPETLNDHYELDADGAHVTSVVATEDGKAEIVYYYTAKTYKATFGSTELTGTYYSKVTAPAGPDVDGKTFTGWKNGETVVAAGAEVQLLADGLVYEAQYNDIYGTTTYEFVAADDGGISEVPAEAKLPDPTSGKINEPIVLPEIPAVAGYTKLAPKWEVTGGAKQLEDGTWVYDGTGDAVTATATWTINEYTVNYYLGSVAVGDPYVSQTYYHGDTIFVADAPLETDLPEGKVFESWDVDETLSVTEDRNVFALINDKYYRVSFYFTETTPTVEQYKHGTEITEAQLTDMLESIDTEGYTFEGWTVNGTDATFPIVIKANTQIRAKLTINKHDVRFWVDQEAYDAGTDPYNEQLQLEYGSEIVIPVDPTKEGHTFIWWDTDPGNVEDNDMDFIGLWEVESYNVTWNNDGELSATTYKYGDPLKIPTPTKEGYKLTGWAGLDKDQTTMPDVGNDGASVTYTAVWEKESYTATWNFNDGVTANKVETVEYDALLTVPAPTREGYDFVNWTNENGEVIIAGTSKMPAGDATFTANWTEKGDVAYVVNTYVMKTDGTYGDPSVSNLTGATNAPVDATPTIVSDGFALDTEKEGYKATGNIAADGSLVLNVYIKRLQFNFKAIADETEVANTDYYYDAKVAAPEVPAKTGYTGAWDKTVPATMPAEDVVLKAVYTPKTYDVIYVVDGKEYSRTEDVAFGTDVTVIDALVKEGYDFAWDKTGTFSMPDKDVTITGTWTAHTNDVIYMVDGTEHSRVSDVAFGTDVTVIDALEKTGYDFAWDKTGTFSMPDEDVIITGTWTVHTHDVIYMVDGTEYSRVEDVAFGTDVTVIDAPVEAGKTFSGWSQTGTFSMPDEDVIITGSWTTNEYTITYYSDVNKTSVVFTYTGVYGFVYNVPTATKEGHTFSKWLVVGTGADAGLTAGGSATITANAEYYADWTVNEIDLVYMLNGGSIDNSTANKSFKVAYGTAKADIPTVAEPTKAGYTFAGWKNMTTDVVDEALDNVLPATMPAERLNIQAQWTAIPYTVTWINGNSQVEDDYIYGETIVAPEEPTKAGYEFSGWLEADKTTYFMDGDVMGEKSLVYTAQWTGLEVNYTVNRYFANVTNNGWMDSAEAEAAYGKLATETKTGIAGEKASVDATAEAVEGFTIDETNSVLSTDAIEGDGSTALVIYYNRDSFVFKTVVDGTETPATYLYGAAVTAPVTPTKTGYTFAGWDGEVPATMPANNVTLTASWNPNKYDLTFNDENGELVTVLNQVEYGTAIAAPDAPVKEGFTFAYWADETGAPMPATVPAGDATYVPVYTAGENTAYYIEVYMMDTEGNYTMSSSTKAFGTTGAPISIVPGTLEGCVHDSEMSVLSGIITGDGKAALKVYYARNKYTVTFNAAEGKFADNTTSVGPTDVYYGAAIPVPADPTREGYEFDGWDVAVPATMPAENLTFNATWAQDEYTITYIVNGVKTVETYKFGETVVTPADPELSGMKFVGWDTEIPATMPAENLVIIAEFEVSVYTVTFIADGNVFDKKSIAAGDTIVVPDSKPTKEFYVFSSWNLPADGIMPAANIEVTANFERVPVELIPMAGSTTVIETVTYKGVEYDVIYGLDKLLLESDLRADYLDVAGDGYFTVTPAFGRGMGTGTKVELYDNVTKELIKTYTIIIFGDIDGDGAINNADYAAADAEQNRVTSWSRNTRSEFNFYKTAAADIDRADMRIGGGDVQSINNASLGFTEIDQTAKIYNEQ